MAVEKYFFVETLSPLYEDVQCAEIFPDSKFFVDCLPKFPALQIIDAYRIQKTQPGFDLKKFVEENFILPALPIATYQSASKPIVQHLNDLWDELTRSASSGGGTLIKLPFPYIVPGGRFREIYYWDSYFTALGLQVSRRFDIIQNMVDNFAYLINEIGFIPNGNRTYYLGRSQPPFFTLFVKLLSDDKKEILLKYRKEIEKEYNFWMDGVDILNSNSPTHRRVVRMPDGAILNRYWDDRDTPRPEAYTEDLHIAKESANEMNITCRHIRAAAESGWDFSSRWFADGKNMNSIQTTDIIPIDLNCLLLYIEETLAEIYVEVGEYGLEKIFRAKVNDRKNAINGYCWNEEHGFYFDYNFAEKNQTFRFTLAATYPLFFGIAGVEQAKMVAAIIEENFLYAGGLITTIYKTGQQWDSPNGWAPLQWMAYSGLKKYGYNELAKKIKNNWTKNCESIYNATGKMMEKYDVTDTTTAAGGGEYPNQDGFGWTNGVYLKMISEEDQQP
jgi:alpha,alpha-trehalase